MSQDYCIPLHLSRCVCWFLCLDTPGGVSRGRLIHGTGSIPSDKERVKEEKELFLELCLDL
jgi:hypothetical protein